MKINVVIDTEKEKPEIQYVTQPTSFKDLFTASALLVQTAVLYDIQNFQEANIAVPEKAMKDKYKEIIDLVYDNKFRGKKDD